MLQADERTAKLMRKALLEPDKEVEEPWEFEERKSPNWYVVYDDGHCELIQNSPKKILCFENKEKLCEYVNKHDLKVKKLKEGYPKCDRALRVFIANVRTKNVLGTLRDSSGSEKGKKVPEYMSIFLQQIKQGLSMNHLDWFVTLISAQTAYLARMIVDLGWEYIPLGKKRAPVFSVQVDQRGSLRDYLELFAKLLPKNCVEYKCGSNVTPSFIPNTYRVKSIKDCAYLYISDKKWKLSAQYRDCAVVLDARVFQGKDVNTFLCNNRWACMILLVRGKTKLHQDGIIDLKIENTSLPVNNDAYAIEEVMYEFGNWLRSKRIAALKANWKELNECMCRVKVAESDWFWQKLRLLTAELLAEFVAEAAAEDYDAAETQAKRYAALWKNLLLPGCCSLDETNIPLEERGRVWPQDYPEIFRQTVGKMFEHPERFLYVPRVPGTQALCHKADDNDQPYYGYVRWTMQGRKRLEPAIYFVRSEFLQHFAELAPVACDANEVLEYCEKNDNKGWFPQRKEQKDRIPRDLQDNKPVPSVRLNLNNVDFVDPEVKQRWLQQLEQERVRTEGGCLD